MSKVHILKTWPEYFRPVASGIKRFEVRVNDRGFSTGDILILQEYNPATKEYTRNEVEVFVSFMIASEWGISSGNCVMSIMPVSEAIELGLLTPQPCGHPVSAVASSDGRTHWCRICESEAKKDE